MQDKKERNFLGIWIPKNIYLNTNLSWTEKILLVEVASLDNEKGCFASNDYFADFLGVTKTTISVSISKLKRLGFIKQISFDGRNRVIKVINAEFKKLNRQPIRKPKGSIKEKLQYSNTVSNTSINTSKKDIKINNKNNLNLDFIDVKDLLNNQIWLDSIALHLKLMPYFLNNLLKEFIAEQNLKDDVFKSVKEQKSHFLNWSKLQITKNRKTNDSWGRVAPSHYNPKPLKDKELKPEISDKEKLELKNKFLKENLVDPYKNYCSSGKYINLNDFGGLISNELKRHGLLYNNKKELSKFKLEKDKKTKSNGSTISNLMHKDKGRKYLDRIILQKSFESMKSNGVKLEDLI